MKSEKKPSQIFPPFFQVNGIIWSFVSWKIASPKFIKKENKKKENKRKSRQLTPSCVAYLNNNKKTEKKKTSSRFKFKKKGGGRHVQIHQRQKNAKFEKIRKMPSYCTRWTCSHFWDMLPNGSLRSFCNDGDTKQTRSTCISHLESAFQIWKMARIFVHENDEDEMFPSTTKNRWKDTDGRQKRIDQDIPKCVSNLFRKTERKKKKWEVGCDWKVQRWPKTARAKLVCHAPKIWNTHTHIEKQRGGTGSNNKK